MTADELAVALDLPALFEVFIGDFIKRYPLGLALDVAEQPVAVLPEYVVEAAGLMSS